MASLLLVRQRASQQQLRASIDGPPANPKVHSVQSCKTELLLRSILYSFGDASGSRINGKSGSGHDSGSNGDDNDCSTNGTGISCDGGGGNSGGGNSGGGSDGCMELEPLDPIQILVDSCWIHISAGDAKDANDLFI